MSQPSQTIVDDHRNMLQVSKKISVFQENNLKSWAFLFFDNVDKVDISWDFFKKNDNKDFYAGKVTFNIKLKKGYKVDLEKAKIGLEQLDACTKFLFWKETKVVIKKSGKVWKVKKLPKQETASA
jgi:hypothetical protein